MMSQVGSIEYKEHESELFPCFIANLAAVNEISIKFLTRPLFRCLFLLPMPASVLLKVANGPQGLGRDYASLKDKDEDEKNEFEDKEVNVDWEGVSEDRDNKEEEKEASGMVQEIKLDLGGGGKEEKKEENKEDNYETKEAKMVASL